MRRRVPPTAGSQHDQNRRFGSQRRHRPQHLFAVAVDPVHVLEHHDQRRLGGDHARQLHAGLAGDHALLPRIHRQPVRCCRRQRDHRGEHGSIGRQRRVELAQQRRHPLAHAPGVVALRHAEEVAQRRRERVIGNGAAECRAGGVDGLVRAGEAALVDSAVDQPRLAEPGFAGNADHAATPALQRSQRRLKGGALGLAADEGRALARRRGLPARHVHRGTGRLVGLDRRRGAPDVERSDGAHLDQALRQGLGLAGEIDRAWRCHLLHARRHMDHRPDHVDLQSEIRCDRAIEHVARVQADAHHVAHAGLAQLALHAERGKAGAHRMVLVRHRRAEQGQDAVAQPTADHAFVAIDQAHHDLQRRLQAVHRRLRIEPLDGRGRALEIGEQHGDPLAFAFAGTAVHRVLGRRLLIRRGRGRDDGGQRLAATGAVPVAGRIDEVARRARQAQLRAAGRAISAARFIIGFAYRTEQSDPRTLGRHPTVALAVASMSV
jgi:hypothetical protein